MMLGNIYRQQVYIEKAIEIHKALIIRDDLPKGFKNLALYELARDYFASGMLDRAQNVLKELSNDRVMMKDAMLLLLEIYGNSKDWEITIDTAKYVDRKHKIALTINLAYYYCELALEKKNYEQESLLKQLT